MANILVVDDHDDMAQAVRRMLVRRGHEADVVNDGKQALRRLSERYPPPDVILLDWYMPGLDGGDVLAVLRGYPRYRGVHVIVYSASFDHQHYQRAMRLGADDYLVKGTLGLDAVARAIEAAADAPAARGGAVGQA